MEHVSIRSIVKPFRVRRGQGFSLDDIKPSDTPGLNPNKDWGLPGLFVQGAVG
jgi:hypothetical protein